MHGPSTANALDSTLSRSSRPTLLRLLPHNVAQHCQRLGEVSIATQLNFTQLSPINERSDPVDSVCRS